MKYSNEKDMQGFKKVDTSSWESLKDNVFIRLVNQKSLIQYDNVAYIKFLDLALTFSVQEKSNDVMLSHLLTEEDLKSFGVSIDEVKYVALSNTTHDRKKRILTFRESALKNNIMYPILRIPNSATLGTGNGHDGGIIKDIDDDDNDNILILSNKHDVFGASYMASFEVLEEVYERFGENFYIIPLSIHQVMCVRSGYVTNDGQKPSTEVDDDLLDMIEGFNDKHNKSWQDILSYKIYYYYGDDGKHLFIIK